MDVCGRLDLLGDKYGGRRGVALNHGAVRRRAVCRGRRNWNRSKAMTMSGRTAAEGLANRAAEGSRMWRGRR